jgi:hypothetical protein
MYKDLGIIPPDDSANQTLSTNQLVLLHRKRQTYASLGCPVSDFVRYVIIESTYASTLSETRLICVTYLDVHSFVTDRAVVLLVAICSASSGFSRAPFNAVSVDQVLRR